jgi:mRNA-degrading endonuclease RelE of RelBE toxin-antitoxin system
MENEPLSIEITLTVRFQKDLRDLVKRYRSVRQDLQTLIEQLQSGEIPGDELTGARYQLFKVRLKNSDTRKGESSGYRVIYYLKTSQAIILVTIYSKSDFSDVSSETIKDAITQYEQENQMVDDLASEDKP